MWANPKPRILLFILVLSPSVQQGFGHHLEGKDAFVGADRIELNKSEKNHVWRQ